LQSFLKKLFGRKIDLLTSDMISPYIKPTLQQDIRYLEEN
jgi:predicted nucleotidyltransferase